MEGCIYRAFLLLIALKVDFFNSYILCLFVCTSLSTGSILSIIRPSVNPLTETFQMLSDLVNIICQERLDSVLAFITMFYNYKYVFERICSSLLGSECSCELWKHIKVHQILTTFSDSLVFIIPMKTTIYD